MAIVEMTKRQVIEVLRKEKLVSGSYGSTPRHLNAETTKANAPGCAFCAVGQVVRAASATTTSVADVAMNARSVAAYTKPMRRIERAFEGWDTSGDWDNEKGRKAAIKWARRFLPAKVRINIGNAEPRRGMKVVG
jgi:hypothetical protein